jgi:DNA-binding NarL/FixJ family response regulator
LKGPLRVVVAEDNFLVRESLRNLLASDERLALVGVAVDYDSAVEVVDQQSPDVVVTDVRMPPSRSDEGIQLARRLRASHPQVGVVVLSQYAEPTYAVGLFEEGSRGRGYLLKDRVAEVGQLVDAVVTVASHGTVVDPVMVNALVGDRSGPRSALGGLTVREREVLAEVASGKNNRSIAATLAVSPRAVEKHINSIFSKLGLAEDPGSDHRVKAVLVFLSDRSTW